MTKETKTTTRKRKAVETVASNSIKLRVINLHDFDLREINKLVIVKKDGTTVDAGFNNIAITSDEDKMDDNTVYIQLKETKPYYNKYQLHLKSKDFNTNDLSLIYFWSEEKSPNPNFLYEF
jgi:hypothetical protein